MSELWFQALLYASLVAMYVLMSTGLTTVLYGDGFLPENVRGLQRRHGWPGAELAPRGVMRGVGVAVGVVLLALDVFLLAGLLVTAVAASDPRAVIYLAEFAIPIAWSALLWRWIRLSRGRSSPRLDRDL